MDTSIASFLADATNPFMLIQTKAMEQSVALPFDKDFSLGSSFELLKDHPLAGKTSGLPDIQAWYGQCFPAQNYGYHDISRVEAPSRLYLKVSFTF